METRELSWKSKVVYIVTVCLITLLIWLGNEGRSPLVYKGSEMQYSVGVIDSEYALVLRDAVARNGTVANTLQYVMNRGSYTAKLRYRAEEGDSALELWEQGRKIAGWTIDPSEKEMTAEFTLSKDAKQLQFKINYSGKGELVVQELQLVPHTLFYTDTYFFMALFLLGSLVVWWYLQKEGRRLTKEQIVDYSVILGVALLATTPMMQTYLYNGDDLCYHLARLEGLKDGILDGQFPVNILPDGLRGNGYMNAMYPYLFLYIGAFLRICRVSLALSYKVLIFLANLSSGISAYVAVKSMCRSRRSVIYAYAIPVHQYFLQGRSGRDAGPDLLAAGDRRPVSCDLRRAEALVLSGDRRQRYVAEPYLKRSICGNIQRSDRACVVCAHCERKKICRDWQSGRYDAALKFLVPGSFPGILL